MKIRKIFGVVLSIVLLVILRSQAAQTIYIARDGISVFSGEECRILNRMVFSEAGKYEHSMKMGFINISVPVNVKNVERLVPGGQCIGIALYTDGIIVVGSQEIVGRNKSIQHPALDAGIKAGDIIKSVNGRTVKNITEFVLLTEKDIGEPIKITYSREGKIYSTEIRAVYDENDCKYRLGLWLKDSAAGIGTLTYYDNDTLEFGALGHAVCEAETGVVMPLECGEIVKCNINDIKKGKVGIPGELRGSFRADAEMLGVIRSNTDRGLFGALAYALEGEYNEIPIASSHSVKTGKATILTTIEDEIEEYDIQITKVNPGQKLSNKGIVIQITDKELIDKTGGIVQGMSGSPIIQDGKLIGAVTHVLVNDPTRGYGIFIENMLDAA